MYLQTGKMQYILKFYFCQNISRKTPEISLVCYEFSGGVKIDFYNIYGISS